MNNTIYAFVLHKRAYQNTSELIDLLTDEYGKIRVISKWSKKSPVPLQTHTRLIISLSGNSELKRLQSYEVDDYFREYTTEVLLLLSYINELVMKLVPSSTIRLCEIYYYALEHLNDDYQNNQYILRIFENTLLTELGYGIDFSCDNMRQSLQHNNYYQFTPQSGFNIAKTGVKGVDILCYQQDKMPSQAGLKYYKLLNQYRLKQLLGNTKLESRKLYEAFQAYS